MADIQDIKIKKLTKDQIITVGISIAPEFYIRLWLMKKLMVLAVWLIGAGLKIIEKESTIDVMANRFLSWELPKNFAPDGGISFRHEADARGNMPSWPIGTNLFTAEQAKSMIQHILNGPDK